MGNPFTAFVDGYEILIQYLWPISAFVLTAFSLGIWCTQPLVDRDKRFSPINISIAVPLGIIPLLLLLILVSSLGGIWSPFQENGSVLIFILSALSLPIWIWRNRERIYWPKNGSALLIGILLFLLLLMLRLSTIHDLLLPPYADSAFHYTMIQRILNPATNLIGMIAEDYYHLGFHMISAWLSNLCRIPTETSMMLTGQLLITFTPLAVFALVLSFNNNLTAARLSALFAAFAWTMPAYAVNWGKYPALSAVCIMPAVIAYAILVLRNLKHQIFSATALMIITISTSVYFHTRLIAVYFAIFLSILVYLFVFKKMSKGKQTILSIISLAGMIVCVLLIPNLGAIYTDRYLIPLVLLFMAVFFTAGSYHHISMVISLSVLICCSFLLVEVPVFLGFPVATLMDIQFLSIILFLPFSIVAGLGFQVILENIGSYPYIQRKVILVIAVVIAVSMFNPDAYRANDCCNYVSKDDILALKWIRDHVPNNALVNIAGIDKTDGLIGSDAGVWVSAYAQRPTQLIPFDQKWFSSITYNQVCSFPESYIYASNRGLSFQIDPVTREAWYQVVFQSGSVFLYRITQCTQQ